MLFYRGKRQAVFEDHFNLEGHQGAIQAQEGEAQHLVCQCLPRVAATGAAVAAAAADAGSCRGQVNDDSGQCQAVVQLLRPVEHARHSTEQDPQRPNASTLRICTEPSVLSSGLWREWWWSALFQCQSVVRLHEPHGCGCALQSLADPECCDQCDLQQGGS